MWVVAIVVLCLPTVDHCSMASPDHPVFALAPASTKDACRQQAFDQIFGMMRRKGTLYPFDVECERST